jgi:hypothetical protein
MALGLPAMSGSGEIRPYCSYDARAGRMFRIDRAQDAAGNWVSTKVDITRSTSFVADLKAIRVGWVHFSATGPVKHMVEFGNPIPERPNDLNADGKPAFRQGFEMTILLSKDAGGGPAREFGSNASCVIEAVDRLHDAYLGSPEGKQGKLPIVKLTDTVLKETGRSTNYAPVFEITGWVDRPAGLTTNAAPAAVAVEPKPVPQPAMADASDFG